MTRKRAPDFTGYTALPSTRVRISAGWEGAGREGWLLAGISPLFPSKRNTLGQPWLMVLWDDEEDPDCHKAAALEIVNA